MLLESRIVHVPAQPEIDADLNEYGHIGNKCRATYGRAAVEAGAPDRDEPETDAIDAIANILHHIAWEDPNADIDAVLRLAQLHYDAEREED